MRNKLLLVLLASAVSGCGTMGAHDIPDRGVESVHQPVLATSTFATDLAAPGGVLAPTELGRLDGWFQGLDLRYGDSIFVDGAYSDAARAQVASLAGKYGMQVLPAAPVTVGAIAPGTVRVVVSRTRAEVPNCPDWSRKSQPNFEERTMPNFGCAVNSNLAAMVADPNDLFHGREAASSVDAMTASKAVQSYRRAAPTGEKGLQDLSKKEKQ